MTITTTSDHLAEVREVFAQLARLRDTPEPPADTSGWVAYATEARRLFDELRRLADELGVRRAGSLWLHLLAARVERAGRCPTCGELAHVGDVAEERRD